jgi:antitoxin component YwqK of YwqJK toxin-antitoxin module
MPDENTLNIAVIMNETGGVKFRYARRLSADGMRWSRDGLFVAYYPDGSVKSEGTYVDGLEHGQWRDFLENGRPAAIGEYVNGKEDGAWTFYRDDGSVERVVWYSAGVELK